MKLLSREYILSNLKSKTLTFSSLNYITRPSSNNNFRNHVPPYTFFLIIEAITIGKITSFKLSFQTDYNTLKSTVM